MTMDFYIISRSIVHIMRMMKIVWIFQLLTKCAPNHVKYEVPFKKEKYHIVPSVNYFEISLDISTTMQKTSYSTLTRLHIKSQFANQNCFFSIIEKKIYMGAFTNNFDKFLAFLTIYPLMFTAIPYRVMTGQNYLQGDPCSHNREYVCRVQLLSVLVT